MVDEDDGHNPAMAPSSLLVINKIMQLECNPLLCNFLPPWLLLLLQLPLLLSSLLLNLIFLSPPTALTSSPLSLSRAVVFFSLPLLLSRFPPPLRRPLPSSSQILPPTFSPPFSPRSKPDSLRMLQVISSPPFSLRSLKLIEVFY